MARRHSPGTALTLTLSLVERGPDTGMTDGPDL